jgi:hypothetical protein
VVDHFELWEEELVFTALMIEEDVRNNSAWNQRCHILSRPKGLEFPPPSSLPGLVLLAWLHSDDHSFFLVTTARKGMGRGAFKMLSYHQLQENFDKRDNL